MIVRFRLLAMFLATLLLATAMLPASSFASGIIDCAVGYVGGDERVVITMASPESGQGIRDSGSFCTQLIGSGNWVGANKFTDWERIGYQRLCYVQFTNGESVIVHAHPEFDSRVVGYQLCLAGDQQYVYYFPDANPTAGTFFS
jgi:hypothetical protein